MVIYSYGSGIMMADIFNFVAIVCNGEYSAFISKLAMTFGLVVAIIQAQIRGQLAPALQWLAMFTVLVTSLLNVKSTVWVDDVITGQKRKIDKVPYTLALGAGTVSSIMHELTKVFEGVFQVPNNMKYHQTGTIFGSRLVQDLQEIKIDDVDFRESFDSFCAQCIFYDLALGGKYTADELAKTEDLWGLLKSKASPTRWFDYTNKETKKREPLTCKAGAVKLEKLWEKEVERSTLILAKKFYPTLSNREAKVKIMQQLGAANKILFGTSKKSKDIIMQQLTASAVREGMFANSAKKGATAAMQKFAADRAYEQSKNSGLITGELASKTLPNWKTLLECVIYALYPLVVILGLAAPMSLGLQTLRRYAEMVVWVNLWPIVYAVVNYIATTNTFAATEGLLAGGGSGIALGYSMQLAAIHADIASQAGAMSISVPFISYAIVAGGVGSMMHIAGHLTSASQAGVSAASHELTTGNYQYGNSSVGNFSQGNTNSFKQDTGARYAGGYISNQDSSGMTSTSFGFGVRDVMSARDAKSSLMDSINVSDNISSTAKNMASSAMESANTANASYSTSRDKVLNDMVQLGDRFSSAIKNDENFTSGLTEEEGNAVNDVIRLANDIKVAKEGSVGNSVDHGVSGNIGVGGSAGGGAGGNNASATVGVGGSTSSRHNAQLNNSFGQVKSLFESGDLQSTLSKKSNYGKGESLTIGDTKSDEFLNQVSGEVKRADGFRESYESNLKTSKSLSKIAETAKASSFSINRDAAQDYKNSILRSGLSNEAKREALYSEDSATRAKYLDGFMKNKTNEYINNALAESGIAKGSLQQGFNKDKADFKERYNNAGDPTQTIANKAINEGRAPKPINRKLQIAVDNIMNNNNSEFKQRQREFTNKQQALKNETSTGMKSVEKEVGAGVGGQVGMFAQRLGLRAMKQAMGIADTLGLSGKDKGGDGDKK
jgi:conjugal transfer mating pair stabilization protein TraG